MISRQFTALVNAISGKNYRSVADTLNNSPALLFQIDEHGNTILHIAARYGSVQIVNLILNAFNKLKKLRHIAPLTNEYDQNVLHLAAQHNSSDVVKTLIAALPTLAAALARCCDRNGKLPIDLRRDNDLFAEEKKPDNSLEALTTQNPLRALSEKLNARNVINRYAGHDKKGKLAQHLKLACDIANLTRRSLNKSDSHPESNTYTDTEKKRLFSATYKLRDTLYDSGKKMPSREDLPRIAANIESAGLGNCHEYCFVALNHLRRLAPDAHAEMMSVQKGDHVIIVIGRAPGSNPADYRTWGDEAVVCDPWSGEAYPASAIPTKLATHKSIKKKDNSTAHVIAAFNSHYHAFKSIYPPIVTRDEKELKREAKRDCVEPENSPAHSHVQPYFSAQLSTPAQAELTEQSRHRARVV